MKIVKKIYNKWFSKKNYEYFLSQLIENKNNNNLVLWMHHNNEKINLAIMFGDDALIISKNKNSPIEYVNANLKNEKPTLIYDNLLNIKSNAITIASSQLIEMLYNNIINHFRFLGSDKTEIKDLFRKIISATKLINKNNDTPLIISNPDNRWID